MVKTERESDKRRREVADLLVLPRPAKSAQNGQASTEKLEHTGPAEKERVALVPQREQLASMPQPFLPRAAFLKGKGTTVCREHQIMRGEKVKVGENCTLVSKMGIKVGV